MDGPYRASAIIIRSPRRWTVRGRLRTLWRRAVIATAPKARCGVCCNLHPRRRLTRQKLYSSANFAPIWVWVCANRDECLRSKAANHADRY